jgi:hypothetical protein
LITVFHTVEMSSLVYGTLTPKKRPDAEYTVHTNFTPNRTLLQTPIMIN